MTFLPQPGLVFTLVAFVAMVAVLVVIHEGGHFLAGRLFGTRIDAFAFGFGRELLGWTDRRGVRWKINAIPLGGYVKFTGDLNEASQLDPELQNLPEAERRGLFAFKPLWQRAIIVVAGPAINFVFAIAVLAGFYMTLGHLQTPPVVERVEPGMAAAAAGIRAGDRITAIDGVSVSRFEDVKQLIRISTGKTMAVAIIRDGVPRLVLVAPRMVTETDAYVTHAARSRLRWSDRAMLAAAMIALLANREGWDTRRARGRAFVETAHDWATNAARYDSVYQTVLAQSSSFARETA
ncbi:MAG: site-2 protease family protein [Sphingomonadales bacterium]